MFYCFFENVRTSLRKSEKAGDGRGGWRKLEKARESLRKLEKVWESAEKHGLK